VRRQGNLHGSAPDNSAVALLLIDVINDFAFPGGSVLRRQAIPMALRLGRLKRRARTLGIPAVYVNDNFGRWRWDFAALVRHCTGARSAGREVARLLMPAPDDYFVLKPKHSGFHETSLEILLEYLGPRRLILTGLTGPMCVFFTASDAYMREYELVIPRDCVCSATAAETRRSVDQMRRLFRARTTVSTRLALAALRRVKER
jgi:nicotinamidase-related amidase